LTAAYVLTSVAEADLRNIVRYTRAQWGVAQVRSYIAQLTFGFERTVSGEPGFTDMSELYPGLRMMHCEHHYIFCLPRKNAPALIVAIFHERMDLMTRLAERLK
jgi:toxin ParE1/3/4